MNQRTYRYTALFIHEKDGGFSVSVPDLPGCFSQGDTYEEALENIQEAIELYLEDIGDSEKELYQPHQSDEQFLCKV